MFETFVVGALPGAHLGVVRQCIDCRAALGPGAAPCPGFGPGCFITPGRTAAARDTQPGDPVERSGVL